MREDEIALSALAAAGALLMYARARRQAASATNDHPRDFEGYGSHPPRAEWPGGAALAVNFAINIEESAEPSIPDGDAASTGALCECPSEAPTGVRDLAAESMFEYGSRIGIWRILRAFEQRELPATVFACARALERLPGVVDALRETTHDVCCHGLRWEDHIAMDEDEERRRIADATASLTKVMGAPPSGWYVQRESTHDLLVPG